ncbi:MAG TPA: lysylphosphatidylglycerol synthase transmembrane domain-containing protein [Syntrophorhabdaceae bacterium]|nr:lysylphosphatidylglycerol synthase transmembrane domain-containing protein [Syntrophorhabdaceae bacterium]
MNKQRIITIAGFLISILLLYLALRGLDFGQLLLALKNADLRFAFLPMLCIIMALVICSYRWSKLVGNGVRFSESFISVTIGLFINNVLPARIGEVARGYALSRKTGLSFTYSVTSVFVDRFFDLIGLLIITFVFLPKDTLPEPLKKAIYMLLGLLIVCATLFIAFSRKRVADKISDRLSTIQRPFIAKLSKRILEIQHNLARIGSPLNLLYFIALAFAAWFFMSMGLYFCMLTLGVKVPFLKVPFICALLNMSLIVPSSPGYIGVYQYVLQQLLSVYQIPRESALAVSLLLHASWYIPYNLMGVIFLVKENMKIKDIQKMEKETEESSEETQGN